jgi:hypothetical protein
MSTGVLARLGADGDLQWLKPAGSSVQHVAMSRLGTAVAAGEGRSLRWAGAAGEGPVFFLLAAEAQGAERWARRYEAHAVDGLGVDDAGRARLLARAEADTGFGGGRPQASGQSAFVVAVGLDGKHRWTHSLPGWSTANEGPGAPRLALAPDGRAFVLGTFLGPQSFGPFVLEPAGGSGTDAFFVRLAP